MIGKFDPLAYLESFYKTASEDEAMQVVLFFLPGMIYRLPPTITTALDLGAGPTVYLPIALRQRALEIFTSDYAKLNRDVLQSWIEDKSVFDWSNVCKWIANIEASEDSPSVMQQAAREKVKAVLELQGGVTDATTYNFGGKVFKCHRLQRSHIEDSLKENGMAITSVDGYKFITHDDIFLLISKKVR
ncbi:unnamed protein product [Haemonchus placei]|uniref:NNMT/PNMT/TEMT family protein n=1 Tax=Haemonchus placei TaxID=6290 RepID=A0A0N4WW51_HAEPC|nr:unnamed protein product [Haemonchus placei]